MRITRTNLLRIFFATASLALLSACGYYYGLELAAKWAFSHKTYFTADELILITVPRSHLTPATDYLLNEGEFEWEGEMVDVLHREVRSDTLFVYGFRDKAETKLNQEAAWLNKGPAHPYRRSTSPIKRIKWVSIINPAYTLPIGARSSAKWVDLPYFFAYASPRLPHPFLEVLYPPPNS